MYSATRFAADVVSDVHKELYELAENTDPGTYNLNPAELYALEDVTGDNLTLFVERMAQNGEHKGALLPDGRRYSYHFSPSDQAICIEILPASA